MVTSPWRTWLSTSVLRSAVNAYQALLQRGGYSASHTSAYLHAVGHFAHWFTDEHLTLQALNEAVVHRFVTEHLPTCRCPGRCQRTAVVVRAALGHLLDVLRTDDRIPARRVALSLAIHHELECFDRYLDHVCGLAARTRMGRRWWVAQFLADQFGGGPIAVHRLTPRGLVAYLGRHGRRYTPASAGVRASALRSYFRFRAAHCGDRVDALIAAMPTVACWRLAALPSALTLEETTRFLQAFDRRTTRGQRGYAMARCMLDLGLRVSEVVGLQLDDLQWRDGTVRIGAGKSRRADVLPLPVLTGRAIAAYLRHARRPRPSRAVFVRDQAPLDAPVTPDIVRHALRLAFVRAGLADRYRGTHILRRTAATQLRVAGASLKQIADILRHRSLDTTTIYTKLDRPQLATVAAPWPGGVA
jgi:site-specific recombinase XerD